jgi:hypothetical protein
MVYIKNTFFYFILFSLSNHPIIGFIVIMTVQLVFSCCLLLSYSILTRQFWPIFSQEIFLVFYFFAYSSHQDSPTNDLINSFILILYLIGLSISVIGVLFEIINDNKMNWIPEIAWINNAKSDR